MKRLCVIVGLIIVAMAGACKKAKGPANVKSAEQNNGLDSLLNMKATINGSVWQTDSAYSYKVKSSGNDTNVESLLIIATQMKDNVATTIKFYISSFTGKSDYVINPPQNSVTYSVGNERHVATSGTLKVSNDTGSLLTGTFYFVADTIVATNGTFKVAIP